MSFASNDLLLAIVHHLLVFSLAGILAFELATIRDGMTAIDVRRVAGVDAWYGILAAAILIVGFSRAVFFAKGWDYYEHNAFFWAKIATFAVVGLLSIRPTLSVLAWRRALKNDQAALPTAQSVDMARRFLWAEVLLFAFIPAFAAAMARGYGVLGQ